MQAEAHFRVHCLQGIFEGGTSLGDIYEGLVKGSLDQAVAEFLADQTSDPAGWALPSIQHAEGFEAYQVCLLWRAIIAAA